MGNGLTRREMNRTSHMMQWLPDRLKSRIVGGNWRQLIANFKLGMSATLMDRRGNDSGLPDLAERRAWSELVLRTAGMVGPQSQVMIALFGEIGVKDEQEVRQMVARAREADTLLENPRELARGYVQCLLDLIAKDATLRAELKPLASVAEIEEAS